MKQLTLLFLVCYFPLLLHAQVYTHKQDFPDINGRSNAVAFVINEEAYVGTGQNNQGTKKRDFFKYNYTTNSWTNIPLLPADSRIDAIAFSLNNKGYCGTGLLATGQTSNDFYEYDPATNQWNPKAHTGPTSIQAATAFVLNGKGYITLGIANTSFFNPTYNTTTLEYNPSVNTWVNVATWPSNFGPGLKDAQSFVLNGKAYVFGGNSVLDGNRFSSFGLCEFTSNGWVVVSSAPTDNLANAKSNSAVVTKSNSVYFIGGFIACTTGLNDCYTRSVLKWHQPTNNWTNMPSEYYYPDGWFAHGLGINLCDKTFVAIGDVVSTTTGNYQRTKNIYNIELPMDLEVTGPSLVCAEETEFILSNPPLGEITWQATPINLFETSSGTGNIATLVAASSNTSGSGTLTFTISTPGCNMSIQKTLWVGKRNPTGFISVIVDPWLRRIKAKVVPVPNATGYEWYLNGVQYTGPGMNSDYVTMPISNSCSIPGYTVGVKAINTCGTSVVYSEYHSNPCYGGGFLFSYYPNPVSDVLTLQSTAPSDTESFEATAFTVSDDQPPYHYKLYDVTRNKVVREGILFNKAEVDVSTMSTGRYILKIQTGKNEAETHQIFIK